MSAITNRLAVILSWWAWVHVVLLIVGLADEMNVHASEHFAHAPDVSHEHFSHGDESIRALCVHGEYVNGVSVEYEGNETHA